MKMLYYQIKSLINLKTLIITQIVIIICAFFMSIVFQNYIDNYKETNQIKIGVINNDSKNQLSNMLIDNFKRNEYFTSLFKIETGKEDSIVKKFNEDSIDAYVVIDKGFSDGLMQYQNQKLIINTKAKNPTKNMLLNQTFSSYGTFIKSSNLATYTFYETMLKKGFDEQKINRLNRLFSIEMVTNTISRENIFKIETISELPLVDSKRYFFIAIPLAFISFICINAGINNNNMKNNWLMKRMYLCSSSNFLTYIVTVASEILIIVLTILPIIVLQYFISTTIQASLVTFTFIIAISFFVIMWRISSYVFKTSQSISIFSTIISFILCILGGCIIPFNILPTWIKKMGIYSPIFNLLKLSLPISIRNFLIASLIWIVIIVFMAAAEYNLLSKDIKK